MCHFSTINPHFFNLRHPFEYERRLNCVDCAEKLASAAGHSFSAGIHYVSAKTKRVLHKTAQVDWATCTKVIIIGLLFFSLIVGAAAASATQPRDKQFNSVAKSPQTVSQISIPPPASLCQLNRDIECRHENERTTLDSATQESYLKAYLSVELSPETLARKIVVADSTNHRLLLDILFEMHMERGESESYIDFVLKHPGLTFALSNLEMGTEARAVYTSNQIVVSERLIHASRDKIKAKLYHELWHMYQVYINSFYNDPRNYLINQLKELILPYYKASEKSFLKIIEEGKKRLSNPVIQKSQLHLFDSYVPRPFFVNMPLSNFQALQPQLADFWTKHSRNTLAPLTTTSDNETFSFFVKSYSIEGQNVALTCYSLANLQDKPGAFVSDLRLTLRTHHQDYKNDIHYNDLGEIDAVLQEFDQKQIDIFFPERRRFHDRKLEKMWEQAKTMPRA